MGQKRPADIFQEFEILCYTFLVQTMINPVFDEVRLSDEMYCVL